MRGLDVGDLLVSARCGASCTSASGRGGAAALDEIVEA
jgi:hypothetical protein